jgi:hypothetical protein
MSHGHGPSYFLPKVIPGHNLFFSRFFFWPLAIVTSSYPAHHPLCSHMIFGVVFNIIFGPDITHNCPKVKHFPGPYKFWVLINLIGALPAWPCHS